MGRSWRYKSTGQTSVVRSFTSPLSAASPAQALRRLHHRPVIARVRFRLSRITHCQCSQQPWSRSDVMNKDIRRYPKLLPTRTSRAMTDHLEQRCIIALYGEFAYKVTPW